MKRVLTFGGASVQLEYTEGRAARIVEFLFARILAEPGRTSARATLRLTEDERGAFTLSRQGGTCCVDRSTGAVASWLLHLACLELARAGTGGLLLHAGAVSWGGGCLLLPGVTGAGKSTLTAFLTARGFKYQTDELVYLDALGRLPESPAGVQGFAAPFKIKIAGLHVFEHAVLPLMPALATVTGHFDVLADPGDARCAVGSVPLSAIIFPRYQPGSEFRLDPISPAQVGLRLLAGVLNADALPDHGFRAITRVASLAAGYDMVFSGLDQIGDRLEVLQLITAGTPAGRRQDAGVCGVRAAVRAQTGAQGGA
jgi:hypothetical protein